MTVKIHITLILLFLYNFFIGKIELIFMTYMFIVMHELSHMIVALLLSVDIKEIELMPVGVNAKYDGNISTLKELLISLAGPLASMFFAIIYNNELYYMINFCIVIFNLIPIYPLDGGRILRVILTCLFGKKKGYGISTYITNFLIFIFILFALFIAAFYKNFFFLLIGMYMLKIAREEIKKEKIMSLINYLQTDK